MKKIFVLSLMLLAMVSTASAQKRAVSILGDSYSTYEGFIPAINETWYEAKVRGDKTDVTDVTQTWWWRYISRNDCKLCVNDSWSGATISYTGYAGNDYSRRSFITRLPNLGCPDVIFIFGGTNDSWAGSPIGEFKYENFNYGDFYSFRPACAYLLQQATLHYPGVDIVFLINDGLKESVTESIKTICDHYKVKYILLKDIDKKSGHPSVLGMKQICEQIEAVIK